MKPMKKIAPLLELGHIVQIAPSNELLIPLNNGKVLDSSEELTRHDFHTWNMYFVLIDRFKDGDLSNTRKVDDPDIHPKANYYGGDFAGITQTIKDGYFDKIGVIRFGCHQLLKTLKEHMDYGIKVGPVTKFSGYHGYWPISSSKLIIDMVQKKNSKNF